MPIILAIAGSGIALAAVWLFLVLRRNRGVCPRCQSTAVRESLARRLDEKLAAAAHFEIHRCRDCNARFYLWDLATPYTGAGTGLARTGAFAGPGNGPGEMPMPVGRTAGAIGSSD